MELKSITASKRPVRPGTGFKVRVSVTIVRLALELLAIYAVWRWLLPDIDIQLPFWLLILAMVAWVSFSVFRFVLATRALRAPETPGLPSPVGSVGRVQTPLAPHGTVRIKGETWPAILVEGERAEVGDEVTVMDMDGLRLSVRSRKLSE
ncbi:MAG: NfeD family protein [Dehalococcoidia bacterium]